MFTGIGPLRTVNAQINLRLFIAIPVLTAYSVDPDQTPHFAASDLGLYYLPMSFLWDVRHTWIKARIVFSLTCLHVQMYCFCAQFSDTLTFYMYHACTKNCRGPLNYLWMYIRTP